jgi:hypothetical protein
MKKDLIWTVSPKYTGKMIRYTGEVEVGGRGGALLTYSFEAREDASEDTLRVLSERSALKVIADNMWCEFTKEEKER